VLAAGCQHCPGHGQASSQTKHVVFNKPECTQAHRISWGQVQPMKALTTAYAKLQADMVVIAHAHLLAASRTAVRR